MNSTDYSDLTALFINCTLKPSRIDRDSHTQKLIAVSDHIFTTAGVSTETIRMADYEVPAGVYEDMTEHGFKTDDWPEIQTKVDAADILIIGTPIWLGQISSMASKVVERLYAGSSQTNEAGQYKYYGKVGGCLITGNEDGVKHCAMALLYSMQHVGYTIPPQADAGWIGEVGPGPSYGDPIKDESGQETGKHEGFDNDFTNRNSTFMTWNLIHMARMLKDQGGIPDYGNVKAEWSDGNKFGFENPEYR